MKNERLRKVIRPTLLILTVSNIGLSSDLALMKIFKTPHKVTKLGLTKRYTVHIPIHDMNDTKFTNARKVLC